MAPSCVRLWALTCLFPVSTFFLCFYFLIFIFRKTCKSRRGSSLLSPLSSVQSSLLFFVKLFYYFDCLMYKHNITFFLKNKISGEGGANKKKRRESLLGFLRIRSCSLVDVTAVPRETRCHGGSWLMLCCCFFLNSCSWWGLSGPSCIRTSGNCFLYCVSSSICYDGIKYYKVYARSWGLVLWK